MTTLGLEVPLSSLSRELKKLWDDDSSRTSASLMNFAVFTEDRSQLEENSRNISLLTRDHACRALSVALDRKGEGESIKAWVTAHCNMVNGKKTVCCEQISFLLNGFVQGRMRNTVFANLNSDLPLILWWQGELTDVFEPKLYTLVDRFIYDSAQWQNPLACYQQLLAASKEATRRFVMQDLAWTRSHALRLAFAALFDEASAQEALSEMTKGRLVVAKGCDTSALFLLAWLATQAGWSFSTVNQRVVSFRNREGQEVTIECHSEEKAEATILELSLSSAKVSASVCYDAARRLLVPSLRVGQAKYEHTAPPAPFSPIDLVADQLARGGKNSLMKKTLPLFLELLERF